MATRALTAASGSRRRRSTGWRIRAFSSRTPTRRTPSARRRGPAFLTGRNSWQLKAAANHVPYFPPEFKTFCEALDEQGWFVGHTTKGWAPGIATNAAGKPRQMTGKAFNARNAQPPATGIGPSDYAANFTDFLDAAPKDKPWCFWYGAIEPHRDYEYGSGVAKGGKRPPTWTACPVTGPTTRRSATTCWTTRSRWSISTGISAGCSRSWRSAACSTTRWSSSPPITACLSRGSKARPTNRPITSRWP